MTAGDADLVGRRSVAGPAAIAVTPFQDHLERRMVGGLRHAPLERPAEVEDPCRAEAVQQAHPPIRLVGQRRSIRSFTAHSAATKSRSDEHTSDLQSLMHT